MTGASCRVYIQFSWAVGLLVFYCVLLRPMSEILHSCMYEVVTITGVGLQKKPKKNNNKNQKQTKNDNDKVLNEMK